MYKPDPNSGPEKIRMRRSRRGTTRHLIGWLALGLFFTGTPHTLLTAAVAETGPNPAAVDKPTGTPEKKPSNKRVCKKVKSTSSRIPQKVCMSEKRWADLAEQGRQTADQMRNAAENRVPTAQ